MLSTLTISENFFSLAHFQVWAEVNFFVTHFLIFTGWSVGRRPFKNLSLKFQKINFTTKFGALKAAKDRHFLLEPESRGIYQIPKEEKKKSSSRISNKS